MAAELWQYTRAREALYRLNIAMAASLWNRLDFADEKAISPDELNALWEIRLANAGLGEGLVSELMTDRDRDAGRRP